MSFLDTAIGTALGGVGGGVLANNWGNLTSSPSVPGINPNKKPMTAKDIQLPDKQSSL